MISRSYKAALFLGFMMGCLGGPASVWAVDLGAVQGGGTAQPVEVANQPIKVTDSSAGELRQVGKDLLLDAGETHDTDFFDVRDYRFAAFYAVPQKESMNEESSAPAIYKVDAFFAVDISVSKIITFGGKIENKETGYQEFGAQAVREDGGEEKPDFIKLTTGQTASRVLVSRIYAPYMKIRLHYVGPKERQKFQIYAYLTR